MDQKLDDLLGVKMTSEMKAALTRIAASKKVEPAELIRRAGYALIEYAAVNGDSAVPLEMEITPLHATRALVKEVVAEAIEGLRLSRVRK